MPIAVNDSSYSEMTADEINDGCDSRGGCGEPRTAMESRYHRRYQQGIEVGLLEKKPFNSIR
jgi:hypothetical protein